MFLQWELRTLDTGSRLPAFGLDVVDMGVLADTDIGNDFADVRAVLDHGIALFHRLDGKLMPDWNIVGRLELDFRILVHHPAGQLVAGFYALDDYHTDAIPFVMHYKIDHFRSPGKSGNCENISADNPTPIDLCSQLVLYKTYVIRHTVSPPDIRDGPDIGKAAAMLATGKDAIPLYMQVKALLIDKISGGEWQPGKVIPSEISLAAELGVSQGTVRKAITDLVESNILRRKQGLGTFVSTHDSDRALFHFFHIVDDDDHKVLPESRVMACRSGKASRLEAAKLGLSPGDEIIRIERVRYLASVPTIVETITLQGRFFQSLGKTGKTDLPNTLYEFYEQQFGITIQTSQERLRAIAASGRDAALLDLEAGTPLLEIERIALTLDKTPVEWRISRCSTRSHYYENTLF